MPQETLKNEPTLKKKYCTINELAKHSKVSVIQIEHYTEKGIVPYIQPEEGEPRLYHRIHASKRLKEIRRFEKAGTTTKTLQQIYRQDVEDHKIAQSLWQ